MSSFKSMIKKVFILTAIVVVFPGFSPEKNPSLLYYNNLDILPSSSAPSWVRIIRVGNMGRNRSVDAQGILFSYKNRRAGMVEIAGSFCDWKPVRMNRGKNGVWYYLLDDEISGTELRYKYRVDGIWTVDPKNPSREDDGIGSSLSLLTDIPARDENPRQISSRLLPGRTVEFRIYCPKAHIITVTGDFNRWNPEHDLLLKGTSGVWHLKRRLPAGTYRYRFIVDGENTLDYYNENSSTDSTGERCSSINVQ